MHLSSSDFFGIFMKPSQTDQLLIHTQKTYLKMKMMIIRTARRTKLNVFKVKDLWNQIQTQLILHNKIFCKFQNRHVLRRLLDLYKIQLYNCNKKSLKSFHQNKLKLKKNVYVYNNNDELKLQINYYENKNWIVIN